VQPPLRPPIQAILSLRATPKLVKQLADAQRALSPRFH
jgi:hypothetical protein